MADGWEDFDTAPSSSSGSPSGAVPAAPAGASGGAPASVARAAPDGWADFDAPLAAAPAAQPTPTGASAPVPTPPTRITGVAPNTAAGVVEGGADTLNVVTDAVGNLIGKPVQIGVTMLHDALAPVFGYDKFTPEQRASMLSEDVPQPGTRLANAVGSSLGAPTLDQVVPATTGQALFRAGARGAVGLAGIGGLSEAPTVLGTLGNAAAGASGGVGGEVAATLAPDEYKPLAALVGNIVGAGIPAAAGSIARGAVNSLTEYAAPATGRSAPILDAGAPVIGSNGLPVTATPNQARIAGTDLQAAASDPAAVRSTLDAPPAPLLQGANAGPTTAQLTRDPGLAAMEYRMSRGGSDAEQAAFKARSDAQNDARVGLLRGVADGGDPAAFPQAVQQQAADVDAQGSARVAQTQQAADANMAQVHAALDQHIAGLRSGAAQAVDAIGGDLPPGSDNQVGASLRAPLDASLQTARARESALWDAIDPDGTLGVSMNPISAGAKQIVGEMSPNAAPLAGNEAGIFQTASALPDVQSFRDLAAFRGRVTDAIRQERSNPQGDPQSVRRLSQLLDTVHQTMDGSVQDAVASDAAQVAAGTMAPEAAIGSRLQAEADAFRAEQQVFRSQQRAAAVGGGIGQGASGNAGRGPQGVPGRLGAEIAGQGGFGNLAGNPSLQSQPPLTANFDQTAAARYADARAATAQRAATFKNAPGVGQVLQGGPTAGTFRTPDSAVPNIIVKVGPQGGDVARAYVAAGGSPEALSDAAAFSLRQAALRPDGTLDPTKYVAWAQKRASFLSEIPDAASRFGAAADAQRAVDAGSAAGAQALKEATATAQRTVDDAAAARAAANKAIQQSAIGKFLGNADPVAQVGSILRDRANGRAQMAQLAQAVKGDPEATAGLQRATAEYIQSDLITNTKGVSSQEAYIRNDRLQTFLKQSGPALREVLTPEQMGALQTVKASLEQSNLSAQVGKGSPTAQLTAQRGDTLLAKLAREFMGPITGSTIGARLGGTFGPAGATAGVVVGGALGKVIQSAREAGITNIEHLKAEALLNPALFRVLQSRVTPQNEASLTGSLASQLRRISLVSGAQAPAGQADAAKRRSPPAPPPAMPSNPLMPFTSLPGSSVTSTYLPTR